MIKSSLEQSQRPEYQRCDMQSQHYEKYFSCFFFFFFEMKAHEQLQRHFVAFVVKNNYLDLLKGPSEMSFCCFHC